MLDNFHKQSLFELRKKSVEEIEKYYRELRKYEYDNNIPLKNITIRKKIHNLMVLILKIDRLLKHEKITIIKDEHTPSNKQVIFAATHIGGNDIVRIFEAINNHAYLMLGDPGIIYVTALGQLLNLNGYLPLNTRNKTDRKIAYDRSIELLNKGGNLLIFPEGAYNVFENLPVMKIFKGTVRMAIETDSEIIPLAIEQYDNNFLISIGKNLKFDKNIPVDEANNILRDTLASLKWDIWSTQEVVKRNSYDEEFIKNYRQSVVDRDDYGDYVYTLNDIYETMYHDKNISTPEEVYEKVKKLEINKNNAFLAKFINK